MSSPSSILSFAGASATATCAIGAFPPFREGKDRIYGSAWGWDPLVAAVEPALAAFSSGRVLQPVRNMLTIEEDKRYLGIMLAVADEARGLKLVSFYPGNAGTRVPTHLAVILLFHPDTGEPLAVMDGRLITEMRTAAVSAAVTNHLASSQTHVLALLGSGVLRKLAHSGKPANVVYGRDCP